MLEFVSVLRRLVDGDVKDAPTADDKVLIVDAADGDKVKEARVGDLPTSVPTIKFMLQDANPGDGSIGPDGTLIPGSFDPGVACIGFFIEVNEDTNVKLSPELATCILVNYSNKNVTVLASPGKVLFSITGTTLPNVMMPPYTAKLFLQTDSSLIVPISLT